MIHDARVFGGKVTSAHGERVDRVRALADGAVVKPTIGCSVRGEGREYEVAVLAISAVSGKVACCVGTDLGSAETKACEDTRKKDNYAGWIWAQLCSKCRYDQPATNLQFADNTMLGDIQFVPKDACIILCSVQFVPKDVAVVAGGALEGGGEAGARVGEGGFSPVLEVLVWVFGVDGRRPAHVSKYSNIRVMDLWR
ncbi:hypothetical protein F0562_018934 [Nyssa sinensis]|uniref:Uncharacterized protein n=1 Tax=Nyssa sinensis TaxID=561372 RepID=A0A5J4ZA50_9ASTE|nr:hypothetical protein F0562_018934 [Nyssa sinensis]